MNVELCMKQIEKAVEHAKKDGVVTAYNWNETLKERTVVAFGIGKFLKDSHERLFNKLDVAYLCDNNSEKWGQEFYGKKCISPDELKEIDNVFVVIVMGDTRNVEKQMFDMGIESISITEIHFTAYEKGKDCMWLQTSLPKIEAALKCFEDDKSREIFTKIFLNKIYLSDYREKYASFAEGGEYFKNGFWNIEEGDCLIDGGAYVGDTIEDYINVTQGNFGKIYSFEYEDVNYQKLCENIKNKYSEYSDKIEAYPCGIWNCREDGWCEHFGESDGTQLVEKNCGQLCKLDTLDSVLENKKVTILKLDIEGAEMQGLEGAVNIIKEQKPKLAICLYHRPEDLWEIPLYIKEIDAKYRMIIKHHGMINYTDTVLYGKV